MSLDVYPSAPVTATDPNEPWQYRILLGVEHPQNRQLLAGLLGRFYSLSETLAEDTWTHTFDLCIFDSLFFGRFAQQIVAQRQAAQPIFLPYLLLLKRSHLSLLTTGQRQQVDDVITMPIDQTELLMRVAALLRTRQQALQLNALLAQEQLLEQQLQADNQMLLQMASQDSLTGIANRRAFDHKLAYEWKLGRREQQPLAAILCDVDYFKAYNDTYGHIAGDQCLRAIAGVLDTVVRRPADMAARYGGEEFVLILPNTEQDGVQYILHRLQRTLRALAIPHRSSPASTCVSMSFGVAIVVPTDNLDPEDLLRAADAALYQAKAAGRDRAVVSPALGHSSSLPLGPAAD